MRTDAGSRSLVTAPRPVAAALRAAEANSLAELDESVRGADQSPGGKDAKRPCDHGLGDVVVPSQGPPSRQRWSLAAAGILSCVIIATWILAIAHPGR
jgi:hypothetical protein